MAVSSPVAPFLWGQGGAMLSPEQIARDREIAAALMQGGVDYSPVDHWLQGAARAAQAGVGALKDRWADEAEATGRAGFQSRWDDVFGSGQTASVDPVAQALAGTPQVPAGDTASYIRQGLVSRGLPEHVADAFLMNMQDESGLNPGINEANPTVPGSRGGYGLYQLTGPRRVAYEQYAQQLGVDPSNVDAQLDFLMSELQGPEAQAYQSIMAAPDAGSAAAAIVNDFLRPAEEHRARRAAAYTGGAAPQMAQAQTPDIASLLGLVSDPWANDTQRSIINALVGQQLEQQAQANDPLRQLQIERAQMENEAMRNPAPALPSFDFEGGQWWQQNPDGSAPFAVTDPAADIPDSVEALDLRAQRAGLAPGTPEYNDFMIKGGGGPMVNINNMPESAVNDFFANLGAQETANYKTILENGPKAARTLAQLDQLESLLAASPQGFEAAATAFAGNLGIDLGNASGVQAAQALINQLVPAQRPPGSGPMSDADLELFKQSVPRIINQPGGNQIIMDTMRQINMYDQALANIVQEATWRGEMTGTPEEKMRIRREMRDQIAALQNPLEQFGKRIEGYERPTDVQSGTGTTSTGLKWSIVP